MPRPPKKRPISITVYEGRDGNGEPTGIWHGYLPIRDADGKVLRRKHFEAKDPPGKAGGGKEKCEDAVRKFEDELAEEAARRAANVRPKSKGVYKLHDWLRYWLHEIAWPSVDYNTFKDYRWAIESLIIPNIDDVELPELEASHIESMLRKVRQSGSHDKPHRAYTRLRMALKAAAARPKETGLWDNPILAVKCPKLKVTEVDPPTVEQAKRIMRAAKRRRNSTRWTVGVAVGPRPGEALAFRRTDFQMIDNQTRRPIVQPWPEHIDLDTVTGVLRVSENLYRRKWLHGCDNPHTCNDGKYHRYPCPKRGAKHARYHRGGCPKITKFCEPGCVEHAVQCKDRHGGVAADGKKMPGGQVRKAPKSDAGTRTIVLPRPITVELLAHLREQDIEQEKAGGLWKNSGALFATELGGLINEHDDWEEAKAILAEAGLPDARPYDLRHAAATMLLIMGVPKRVVMDMMGWSSEAMLKRYQHIVEALRQDAADALGGLLWGAGATDHATELLPDNVRDINGARRKAA